MVDTIMDNISSNINHLGAAETRVGKLLCESGLSQMEISENLGYTLRHTKRLVSNLKCYYNAKNLAHLGYLWKNKYSQFLLKNEEGTY